jgi:hypothetical protein
MADIAADLATHDAEDDTVPTADGDDATTDADSDDATTDADLSSDVASDAEDVTDAPTADGPG